MKRNTIWGLLLCLNALFLLINGSSAIQFPEKFWLYAISALFSAVGVAQCIDALTDE